MPSNFKPAPEVAAIARELIADFHHHLQDDRVRIDYLFCEKPQKARGRIALGTARKITNLAAYLAGEEDDDGDEKPGAPFFVITILEATWRFSLKPEQRFALVDHELCHLWAEEDDKDSEKVKLSLLPHDLEEFHAIVRRHGMWLPDVEKLVKAAQDGPQMKLEEPGESMREGGITSVTMTPEKFGQLGGNAA